jgi:hypothetical protein
MAIGYFGDLNEAKALIAATHIDTEGWDALSPDAKKEACLYQSFDRIWYSKEFILPTLAEATATELPTLKKAQAEMALYLALHVGSEARRKGLQVQGVTEADVVGETYDKDLLKETPIPAFVRDILCSYLAGIPPTEFGMVDLCRDENYGVDEDACALPGGVKSTT